MDGPPAKVGHLFGMAQRPGRIIAGVPRVRARACVAEFDGRSQCIEGNGAGKAAVALAPILAVPTAKRQPHFNLDI